MSDEGPAKWERALIEKMVYSAVDEQRKARRWGIFFKLFFVVYLLILLGVAVAPKLDVISTEAHTALVDLNGLISADSPANADDVVGALQKAFKADGVKGVILRINSPGGSPVQSEYIYAEIKRLRKKYPDVPLYAVVSELCASGGYYVAAAADKIYAQKASMVGSIGVLMNGFGVTEIMKTVGVERRLYTAGKSKGFLDPFTPVKEDDVVHIKKMLEDIHQLFIDRVREGRGKRLKENDELFTGLIWTGEQAKALGLIDEFASPGYVAREIIGEEDIINYTSKGTLIDQFADKLGTHAGASVLDFMSMKLQ
ncbi:MAG: S49 family peptidase [Methylococcales bacterium]|jgi:protease IV|nr:S49 family peptidase [Methylococcales bacterium]